MSATLALPMHTTLPSWQQVPWWELSNYAYFRKCGEITISPDEQCFGFNCNYCPGICLQLDVFMQHIREQHGEEIQLSYLDEQTTTQTTDLMTTTATAASATSVSTASTMIMDISDVDAGPFTMTTTTTTTTTHNDKRIKKSNNWNEEEQTKSVATATTPTAVDFQNTQSSTTRTIATATAKAESPTKAITTNTCSTGLGLADMPSTLVPDNMDFLDVSLESLVVVGQTISEMQPEMSTVTTATTRNATKTLSSTLDRPAPMDLVYIMENTLPANIFSYVNEAEEETMLAAITESDSTQNSIGQESDPFAMLPDDTEVGGTDVGKEAREMDSETCFISSDLIAVATHDPSERVSTRTGGVVHEAESEETESQRVRTRDGTAALTTGRRSRKRTSATLPKMTLTPAPTPMPDASVEVNAPITTATTITTTNSKTLNRRELERNKEIVSYVLAAYERHEKLWNPKHPEYKYNAKRSVYNELSPTLARDLKLNLSGAEIFSLVKDLRGRYRRELTKFNALGGKYKSRLWYFERMHFLRSVIEHKRAEREAKSANEGTESEKSFETDSEPSKSTQNREALSYIIDAFKRQECLWNPQHLDYANCNKKELYREISTQLSEDLNYEMSGEECFTEIQKLRTRYRKELRIMIKHKGLYIPKLWCFEELEFLHKILQEQIFTRISKKKGVVETTPKSKFINADCIEFEDTAAQLQFIEIYRNYMALWDVDHPDFRSAAYRSKAHAQMLDELNDTFNAQYTLAQLEKTLFQLRKDFSVEKQKILTNSDAVSTSIIHAKLNEFLEPNLGPFRCDVCQALVKTSDQYKVHRSGHDGTQPFICTLCGKGFQMPCNLTVHIRRHRRDFPYACENCDKRFATSTEVAIHLRTHTGERPYICDLCGKSFKTWSFFDIHRRTHLNQSTFHCPICDKGFYEKNRFTDHMNGHLNIRKHLCNVCGKTFTTYGNLKKHNELHLAVKKYKCATCGKRFAQFASLRWHKKREHMRHSTETYEQ